MTLPGLRQGGTKNTVRPERRPERPKSKGPTWHVDFARYAQCERFYMSRATFALHLCLAADNAGLTRLPRIGSTWPMLHRAITTTTTTTTTTDVVRSAVRE